MASIINLNSPKEAIELQEIHSSQARAGIPPLNVDLSSLFFPPISPEALSPGARSVRLIGQHDESRGRASLPAGMSLHSPVSAHSTAREDRSSPETLVDLSRSPSPSAMREVDLHALALSQATDLAKRGDVVGAAARLEHSRFLEPRDLSIGFDVHDHSFGDVWRGVYSIGKYQEQLLVDIRDLAEIRDMLTVKRNVILVKNDNGNKTLHIFRPAVGASSAAKGEKGAEGAESGVEYLDRKTGKWRSATQEDIDALKLQDADLFVATGDAAVPTFDKLWDIETPSANVHPTKDKEYFYHEKQLQFFCAVHATNAYFGHSVVNIPHYRDWVRRNMLKPDMDPDRLYKRHACEVDADAGVDPVTLCNYLKDTYHLNMQYAQMKKIANTGKAEDWISEELSKIPENCDRVIIGSTSGVGHFLTLRCSSITKKWHVIDSNDEELDDQLTGYISLKKAIENNPCARNARIGSQQFILFERPLV